MSAPALESAPRGRVHHLLPAALVAGAVGLLVVLPELFGPLGRLAAVLVLQLGLVLAWVLTTGIRGFAGALALGAAAAVAADLALVLPARPTLGGLLLVLGLGFLAAVVQQMTRRHRPELVASLSGGAVLLCAIGALAALLLIGRAPTGSTPAGALLLAVGAALVAGHLVDWVLPRPELAPGVPRGIPGLAVSVLTGAAVAFAGGGTGDPLAGPVALVTGAVLGLVAGLGALAASYVVLEAAGESTAAGPPWATAVLQAVVPLAACAPVALGLLAVL